MDTNMNIDVDNWINKTKISKQMISYLVTLDLQIKS